ncbi:hypothetical protein NEHOM01_2415 [Nematocida homosporus]|uniref:uncharacterized protein n=1 Tax=Nematocida homosporus TaxID=1912981 RepID=UPI0022205BCF|nr:uncharacterized protein NEHOM01_2415 [Nematocida homosporus]KAI5187860.1 hypothetical protein NEHOM01_2415 [Nematocida homosporus]
MNNVSYTALEVHSDNSSPNNGTSLISILSESRDLGSTIISDSPSIIASTSTTAIVNIEPCSPTTSSTSTIPLHSRIKSYLIKSIPRIDETYSPLDVILALLWFPTQMGLLASLVLVDISTKSSEYASFDLPYKNIFIFATVPQSLDTLYLMTFAFACFHFVSLCSYFWNTDPSLPLIYKVIRLICAGIFLFGISQLACLIVATLMLLSTLLFQGKSAIAFVILSFIALTLAIHDFLGYYWTYRSRKKPGVLIAMSFIFFILLIALDLTYLFFYVQKHGPNLIPSTSTT